MKEKRPTLSFFFRLPITGPMYETHILAPQLTASSTAELSLNWPLTTVTLLAISGRIFDGSRTKRERMCPSRSAAKQNSIPAGPPFDQYHNFIEASPNSLVPPRTRMWLGMLASIR